MDILALSIFLMVYLGMFLGRLPRLALDRTGVALLGAIALIALDKLPPEAAWLSIDVPTMAMLFGLMVVSSQFRLGGFYAVVARKLAFARLSPPLLAGLLIAVAAFLSAILINDVVCLAMTPVLSDACLRRGLNPKPYLIALACAANIGSAATLIGNPQNMLIGQKLGLSFSHYLWQGGVAALLCLAALWLIMIWQWRGSWHAANGQPLPSTNTRAAGISQRKLAHLSKEHGFNRWQTGKGLLVMGALMAAFLFTDWQREILALAAAGIILTSRRMASRDLLGLVDWHLLALFAGLFIVNHAFSASGMMERLVASMQQGGVNLHDPVWLYPITAVLSNLVSNVPAVMLLLPAATHPLAGPVLALSSTLAGNLLIVGSIANIIVVEQAARLGIKISWSEHAKTGVPVTLATLGIAALWLYAVCA